MFLSIGYSLKLIIISYKWDVLKTRVSQLYTIDLFINWILTNN